MLTLGYDVAAALTNAQQLWLPAKDLGKIKLLTSQNRAGRDC